MSRLTIVWWTTKHAWCISNGIRTVWCDPNEYNETIQDLLDELDN